MAMMGHRPVALWRLPVLGEESIDLLVSVPGSAVSAVIAQARSAPMPVLAGAEWRRVLAGAVGECWWVVVTPHADGVDDPVWRAWKRGHRHYADALMTRSVAWNVQRGRGRERMRRLWVPQGPFEGDQVYLRDVLRARSRAGQPVRVLDSTLAQGWVEGQRARDLVVIPDQGVFVPCYSDGAPAGAFRLCGPHLVGAVVGELARLWERAVPVERWTVSG